MSGICFNQIIYLIIVLHVTVVNVGDSVLRHSVQTSKLQPESYESGMLTTRPLTPLGVV